MFSAGDRVFVRFQRPKDTGLIPATVQSTDDGTVVVAPEDPSAFSGREIDEQAVFYFHSGKEFMQQPAVVALRADTTASVGLALQGQPVSAESRECYRVVTLLTDLKLTVDDVVCALADVSLSGFAVVTPRQFEMGSQVPVSLELSGERFTGRAVVQSLKTIAGGNRYGFLAIADVGRTGLSEGLRRLTMEAQRQQLRRRSGAA